jgi:hypothetical protein
MATQLENQTSSVGAAWPPAIASYERMRGFYDQLVDSSAEVDTFVDHFHEYAAEAESIAEVSRLSIRLLTDSAGIADIDRREITIEGALPVDNEYFIVYTAVNAHNRLASANRLAQHREFLDATIQNPRRSDLPELSDRAFEPLVIDSSTPQGEKELLIPRFLALYGMFGYNQQDVSDLLVNDANTIVYAEDDDGVVSTGMAEQATITVKGYGDVRIAEITEAVTRPESRGRGLYTAVSAYLVDILRQQDEAPHVIYGETNLTMPGAIKAAHSNGRNFSYHDRETLGILNPNFGILQQNFKVEDGKEDREYNDFALSYFPAH